jgi:hypothetical protein
MFLRNVLILTMTAAAVFSAQRLPAQSDNLLDNPSFEEGTGPWAVPAWAIQAGQKYLMPVSDHKNSQGPAGSKSLRIDNEKGKDAYLPYPKVIQLPKDLRNYSLALWTRSVDYETGTKGIVNLSVEVYTADRSRKLVFSVSTPWNQLFREWTYFQTDFTLPDEYTQASPCLRLSTHSNAKGTTWIDHVYFGPAITKDRADTGGKLVIEKGVHEAAHGGVYYPGETIAYTFHLKDITTPGAKAVASWRIQDFDGALLASGKQEVTLDKSFRMEFPSLGDYRGYFVLKLDLAGNNASLAKGEYSGLIVEPQQGPRDPFFSSKGCSSFEKHVRMGFGTRTMGGWIFSRSQVVAPGKYNFVWSDKALAAVRNAGYTNVYGVITMNNMAQAPYERDAIREKLKQGVDPLDARHFEEARDYFRAIIAHYGAQGITDWCVPDELTLLRHANPFVFKHYVQYVKIFSEELKKANPSYTFSAGGETLDNPLIKDEIWEKIKDHVDGLCSDAYPQQTSVGVGMNYLGPEQLKLRERFTTTEQVLGPGKYIVNEETGSGIQMDLPLDSDPLREFAIINARMLIIAKSVHSIKRWTWFLVEDSPSAWNGVFDYGMWKNFNPRPHAATYAVVTRALAGAKGAIEVKPNADVYSYVFERQGKTVIALWALTKELVDARFDLPAEWQGMDLMGRRIHGGKGVSNLKINDRPVFLELDAPQAAVADAIRNGVYAMPEIDAVMNRKDGETMNVFILNKTNRQLEAEVAFGQRGLVKKATVPPLARIALPFPCPVGAELVTAAVAVNKVRYDVRLKEDLYVVEKLDEPPALEGTLKGFEKVQPLVFDSSSFLKPLDAEAWGFWKNKDDLSARVYLGYDKDYFYIAADVTDDVHISRAEGNEIWNQDCVQYAFDAENDAFDLKNAPGGYGDDDREFCMALTPRGPQNFCYTGPAALAGKLVPEKTAIKISPEGHTIYEARVPWSYLSKLGPKPGSVFGFNVTLFDLDSPRGATSYHMELSPGIAAGKNPAHFKRFMLK